MKNKSILLQEVTKQAVDFYRKVIERQEANLFEVVLIPDVAVLRYRARPVFYKAYATVPDAPIEEERLLSAVQAFYRISDEEARNYLAKKDMLFECDGILLVNGQEIESYRSRTLTKSVMSQPDALKTLEPWCQRVYTSSLDHLKKEGVI